MHYQPLPNDKKVNVDMPDVTCQYASISQLTELNRTRTILLHLTGIQFVLSLAVIIAGISAYVFGYTWGIESCNSIVRFLPFLSCICFSFGLLAASQYHVKGLLLFENLVMLDLILTYLTVTIFIIIPICLKKYPTGIIPVISVAFGYQIIFCIISFLPGYTIRTANKLSTLLTNNQCSIIK